jgi:hypothetical protein
VRSAARVGSSAASFKSPGGDARSRGHADSFQEGAVAVHRQPPGQARLARQLRGEPRAGDTFPVIRARRTVPGRVPQLGGRLIRASASRPPSRIRLRQPGERSSRALHGDDFLEQLERKAAGVDGVRLRRCLERVRRATAMSTYISKHGEQQANLVDHADTFSGSW